MAHFTNLTAEVEKKRLAAIYGNLLPESYWVECIIPRDGDTTANIGAISYKFKCNEHGHSVCEVVNLRHYNHFLSIPHLYRPYVPPEVGNLGNES